MVVGWEKCISFPGMIMMHYPLVMVFLIRMFRSKPASCVGLERNENDDVCVEWLLFPLWNLYPSISPCNTLVESFTNAVITFSHPLTFLQASWRSWFMFSSWGLLFCIWNCECSFAAKTDFPGEPHEDRMLCVRKMKEKLKGSLS